MREHAEAVEGLCYRLEAVRFAGDFVVRDRAAYGTMCAWVADCFEERFERQNGVVEYLAENLRIAAVKMHEVADAFEGRPGAPSLETVLRGEYWIAKAESEPGPRLAEQIQPLVDQIVARGWADPRLAGEPVAPVSDLAGVLDDFEPLRDLVDRLIGKPDVVAAQAKAWHAMSDELYRIDSELQAELDKDRPGWTGESHATYWILMDNNANAIGGMAATAAALGAAVEGAGAVMASALTLVRRRSDELAGQLVVWASDGDVTDIGLVAAVAKWALMVAAHLITLATGLENLRAILEG